MNKMNRFFWEEQIRRLPALSQKHSSYKDFTGAVLQDITEILGIERVTYLVCVLKEGRIDYEVTAETFPADRNFITRKSSELTLLLVSIIMEKANQRYIEKVLTVEGEKLDVKAFQICLPELNAQHILVLTTPAQGAEPEPVSEDDKQAGFKYLALFAEHTSNTSVAKG